MKTLVLDLRCVFLFLGFILAGVVLALPAGAEDVDSAVKSAEAKRIAAIEKVRPSVVAIFGPGGLWGGARVFIDREGYALTCFHVEEGYATLKQCGLG
jgi:hypothetical protein